MTGAVAHRGVDDHGVAAVNGCAAVDRRACREVGLHVPDTVRSDDCEVFVVVDCTAIIQRIVDSGNALEVVDVLVAAVFRGDGVVLCSSLIGNIRLDRDGVVQDQFSTVRGLAEILVDVVVRVSGINDTVEVVRNGASAGIRQHVVGVPVLHIPLFCFTQEVVVRIAEIHRVRGVIDVQRHDSVPLIVGLVVEVCCIRGIHSFQLDVSGELVESKTIAAHERAFHIIDIAAQCIDIADFLTNLTVIQLNRAVAVRDIHETVQTTAASDIAKLPANGGCRILVTEEGNLGGVDRLVIVGSTISRSTVLVQHIRRNRVQRHIGGTATVVRVAGCGSPRHVAVLGIERVQQQRLCFQRRQFNRRSIHDQVTGTTVRLIVGNRRVSGDFVRGSLVAEHTAEIQAIPVHGRIRQRQRDGRMLTHGRDTGLAQIVQGIPEGSGPEGTSTNLGCIDVRDLSRDIEGASREQSGVAADLDPGVVLIAVLDRVSNTLVDTLPVVEVKVEGRGLADRNTLIESLLNVHRTKCRLAVTVLAVLSLIEARILLTSDCKLALELNLLVAVVEGRVGHGALGVRDISVGSSCGIGGLVDFALDDTVIGGEGSAGTANLEPLAHLATLGDGTVIPLHIRVGNRLVVEQLTADSLVDRTFPVLVVVNRVCGGFEEFQRVSLAVVPEMIRNIHDNHTVLDHAMSTGVDDLSTLHAGTGDIGDNILAITIDNAVVVSAIGRMDNHAVAGVIRNTVIREQSIQIADNTGNTGDTDIGLVVEFQNGQSADGLIAAEVPAVVAACSEHAVSVAGVIEQRLAVAGKVHMVSIGVPVTGEVLDGLPAFRQSQVVNNLIAAVQRIPERTASLQSRQNLHVVDRTHADNEVAVFLTVLVCCTNLTLLALRDVHDSVGKQSRFTLRS